MYPVITQLGTVLLELLECFLLLNVIETYACYHKSNPIFLNNILNVKVSLFVCL